MKKIFVLILISCGGVGNDADATTSICASAIDVNVSTSVFASKEKAMKIFDELTQSKINDLGELWAYTLDKDNASFEAFNTDDDTEKIVIKVKEKEMLNC